MALPVTFNALTAATMADLDSNFAALGALTTIPCTIAGTNALTFTPAASTPTLTSYSAGQGYSGIAVSTNTGPATATVGTLGALSVYRDTGTGPVPLSGGEMVVGNFIALTYDPALNGSAGGFHLPTLSPVTKYQGAAAATITAGAGATLTAAQMTGAGAGRSIVLRQGSPGSGFNDTTDTATNILTALAGAVIGSSFQMTIINTSGETQTLVGGSGVTVNATNTTTATGATHSFTGIVTATGTPAITIYG